MPTHVEARRIRFRLGRAIAAALLAIGPGRAACGQAVAPPLDPSVDPSRFRVTVFAEGLNYPKSMQQLADGSLLVATSRPNAGGDLFNSTGELVRLVDADGDGRADGPGTVLAGGLPGAVQSVRLAGGLAFVTSVQDGAQGITVLRRGATPADPFALVGRITMAFPADWEHQTYGLATRTVAPGTHEVYFNVGSRFNASEQAGTVALGGLIGGSVAEASIYRVTVQEQGAGVAVSGLTQVARGLRNAAGLAFRPGTGDLYFQDNGIDSPANRNEPLSADELNRISAADLGGPVEDFGFVRDYIQYRTGARVGSGATQPVFAFQPIPDPATGSEAEGAVEIAFAPSGFPSELAAGVFVGFHGKFSLAGLANEENPLGYYDPATGRFLHFIPNSAPGIGHLDGLLATADSLFAADLASGGSVSTAAATGVIYQIRAVPEPAAVALLAVGGLALAARRRRLSSRRPRGLRHRCGSRGPARWPRSPCP